VSRVLLLAGLVFAALPGGRALATTQTFTTQGCGNTVAANLFTVPAGVTSVRIQATGAAGSDTQGPPGGLGDGVSGTLSGLAGGTQVLDVCVDQGGGAAGATIFGAPGSGGGASGVSLGSDFSSPVLVAGGGGGGSEFGGGGGGGSAGMPVAGPGNSTNVGGGGGGNNTTAMGGAGGTNSGNSGCNGGGGGQFGPAGPGSGGAGGTDGCGDGGGGGGGGYFGGGGGAGSGIGGGGGGGGSDFCAAAIAGCTVSSGAGTQTVAGSATGDAQVTITYMFARPSASITAPADNQTFNLNQSVQSTFSCTEGSGGPGIRSCADSNGTSGTTGTLHGTLDTSTVGAHTYTVTATSKDGQTGRATINYTVASPPASTSPTSMSPAPAAGCQDPTGAYNQGFNTGFNSGFNIGFNSGFNAGFNSGFRSGFTRGFGSTTRHGAVSAASGAPTIRAHAIPAECDPQFNQGFNTAFNVGFNSGFQKGFNSGFASGFNSGFDDGFRARHHHHHHHG
jgi:hypothetical protein